MKKSETLQVVVDRSRWYRGQGPAHTRLRRRQDGLMCCLGFVCLAAGHTEAEIEGKLMPSSCANPLVNSSKELDEASMDNDNIGISDPERERRITDGLARVGISISFIDGTEG
jgi:hypothetical protein